MIEASRRERARDAARTSQIVMGLLEAVERSSDRSQRWLARELGISLGLVNAYIKRCARKGLIKVKRVPAHRFMYYLTPKGFAEKSRLTLEYISYSFEFFRRARTELSATILDAKAAGVHRLVILGVSDLAEIAILCALESGVVVVAAIGQKGGEPKLVGVPVVGMLDEVAGAFDGVLPADIADTRASLAAATARCGARVFVPPLLGGAIQPKAIGA